MEQKRIQAFHEGQCIDAYRFFGAHFCVENHQKGVRFTVYAPHAVNVYVAGSFTDWGNGKLKMDGKDGIWALFVPDLSEGESYKYVIQDYRGNLIYKADPYAFYSEVRPSSASRLYDIEKIRWDDLWWQRGKSENYDQPVNIYEVYAGGWKHCDKEELTYRMLENELIPYVKKMGFTHIELMPLNEYPFDGSWGYQASGYFSVTSRYGTPEEFASFVNACHLNGIGVIMDIVPVHFVKDAFGLVQFDGQPLYEYGDRENAESEWSTMNFNLWNEEVRCFLMSAAAFWCDVYHMDGLRVDAVSNLIYWGGNSNRGVNEGALNFVKRMNYFLKSSFPGVMLIAEDSSDYPKVTAATIDGGLGFDYKWDLGWMNDTLKYYSTDPYFRHFDHHKITFSMSYFFSEKFLLPFSHDENVHGKKTIIDRMWGSYEQKFAQVRNLYAYMYAHPGKKLNFMGNELAMFREFDEKKELDWDLKKYPVHDAFTRFFADLNHIYLENSCLYQTDYRGFANFHWILADNDKESIYAFCRENESEMIICLMNCLEKSYVSYQLEVPEKGEYREIFNTESEKYGGCAKIENVVVRSYHAGNREVVSLDIAPWSAIYLKYQK